jgi:zinc transport system ATP-binding protein
MTIQTNHLFFQYEETPILEDISFEIKAGEFIGVFGPNGGGKTTLLKLIMSFLKPRRGTLTVSVDNIGYVPQISQLDRQFPLTALDVVMMGCLDPSLWSSYESGARKKALQALCELDLKELQDHPFGALSVGQTQRVLLARALVSKPDILLLDEPTASVDAKAEAAITHILENLKGKITLIMVTHDLHLILKKADRLLCVNRHITTYSPTQVCDHFSQGLYHPQG